MAVSTSSSFRLFVLLTFLASSAFAQDTKFKIGMAQVQFGTAASSTKASAIYDSDRDNFNGWLAGLTLKVPFGNGSGSPVLADEISSNWMFGTTLGKEFAFDADKMRIQLEPEFGFRDFVYYPDTVTKKSKTKYSYAIGSNWLYYREPDDSAPMAFQVIGRFSKDWTASSAVGIVTPATNNLPALVETSEVISPPTESAGMTGRLFYWKELKMGSSWAIGPSLALVLAGPKLNSMNNTVMMRNELWLYWFITSIPIANLRIGIAPYLDKYFKGESTDNRILVPGASFQIRMNDPIFTY